MNDKSMEQTEKVKRAISYIEEMEQSIQVEVQKKKNTIVLCEQTIKEVENTIERLHLKQDMNINHFSPYDNLHSIQQETELNNRIISLGKELNQCNLDLQELLEKKNRIDAISSCLFELDTIVNKKEIDGKINIKINEDESDGQFIGIKVLETQEMERQRIARDLHDSTIQNLTSLVHKTEVCLKLSDVDSIRVKLELATMIDNIKLIIDNMREIIYNLRPMSIQDLGLIPTIQKFVTHYMKQSNIQVIFHYEKNEIRLDPLINLAIYRIIQEACNNIYKYAKASTCIIELKYINDTIVVSIEDDGIGITGSRTESNDEHSGFGLSIMKERAMLLSGQLSIETKSGYGTKIIVKIPISEYKEDR